MHVYSLLKLERARAFPGAAAGESLEGGEYLVTVQYSAPCVLPWVWDVTPTTQHHLLSPHALSLHSGTAGAPLFFRPLNTFPTL